MKCFTKRARIFFIITVIAGVTVCLLSCKIENYTGGIVRVENQSGSHQIIVESVTNSGAAVLYEDIVIENYRDFLFEKEGSYTFAFGNGKSKTIKLKDNDTIDLVVHNY